LNVFVSYTRRDGLVTNDMLHALHGRLSSLCRPFVHAVEQPRLRFQQLAVIRALLRSRLLILIESPAVTLSPWVRFELFMASILRMPVVRLSVNELAAGVSSTALTDAPAHARASASLSKLLHTAGVKP